MKASRLLVLLFVVALCAAGLLFVFSVNDGSAGGANALGGSIRLNEIMTSNKGVVPDENGDYPDWIEIHNTTNTELSVAGYGLSDDKLTVAKWVFPSGTTIPAGGYLVVFCSGNAEDGPLHASFKLSASDDLILTNASGHAVDSLKLYSVATGSTIARGMETGAWAELAYPSPGFPNTPEGAQQYRDSLQLTAEDNGVRINEFMASNATTLPGANGDYPDWIELYNTTDTAVDISGCGLSDDLTRSMKWVFPEGTSIPAHGILLIYCSGRDGLVGEELHAPFSLRAYKEDVVFSGRNGAVIDSYSFTNQQPDISMARIPDGTGDFQTTTQPTPGHPNTEDGFAAHMRANPLPKGDILLSEAMCNNVASLASDGRSPDWIELYNRSGAPLNLGGYALSNNPSNPAKWVFPDVTIGAGEYMLVLATGENIRDTQKKNLETNFALSSQGDVLLLFSPEGELLDKLQLKNAGPDVSYGRIGESLLYFDKPTPGAANEGGYAGVTIKPTFSTLPGVYDAPVEVELLAETGARVYYTADSTPPSASSTPYTGPIRLEKNTVIRAVAIRDGFLAGPAETGTFLFRSDNTDHALPIATLVMDPDDLWNEKTGIYAFGENYDPDLATLGDVLDSANFYQGRGYQGETIQEKWERSAHFSIFDKDNKLAFAQDVDARIAGAFGRSRAQKAFNITARAEYGDSRMRYPFFDNRPFTEYKSLVLRAGAQDQNRGKIRDELATGLLEGTDVNFLFQAYKPYVLYLNGEYWGVYFLKEKRSRFFVAAHEGIEDTENLDLLKASTQVSHGSNEEWMALSAYVKSHDLSNEDNYRYVSEQIDVNSFMDYMICEIYSGNTDDANIQYYKLPGGKFKWVYYDFCWGFGNDPTHNTLQYRRGSKPAASDLFNAMLKNAGWRDAFIRRFSVILEEVYAPERVNALVDELYAAVQPEIEREREKFNQSTFMGEKQRTEVLGSYKSFETNIEFIRNFANERPAAIKAMLKSEFNLSDSYMREVFP